MVASITLELVDSLKNAAIYFLLHCFIAAETINVQTNFTLPPHLFVVDAVNLKFLTQLNMVFLSVTSP